MTQHNLTPRLQRVLDYLSEFPLATNEEIADALDLNRGTITKQMREIYKAYNITNTPNLLMRLTLYKELGWLQTECDWCGDWRNPDGFSTKAQPTVVDGNLYESIREAAKAEGLTPEGMRQKKMRGDVDNG